MLGSQLLHNDIMKHIMHTQTNATQVDLQMQYYCDSVQQIYVQFSQIQVMLSHFGLGGVSKLTSVCLTLLSSDPHPPS